jgi:hypothetical protein
MTVYSTYAAARCRGGWTSRTFRSPKPHPPLGDLARSEACERKFRSVRYTDGRINEYVLAATSHTKGYKGVASKTYYSVWGRFSDSIAQDSNRQE